ncbi:MAG: ParA family protein [Candidatus Poribacteria bacterium]
MSKVIAVANQKGGVGKTTTAINLSACLADLGFDILLLDTDPQSNTTSGLGFDPRKLDKSIYHVLIDNVPITEIIKETAVKRLSLVPSNADLVGAEVEMVSLIAREMRLRSALQSVRDQYDYIIIDCPPSLGLITLNALTACDSVIIPIQCEYYALEGLGQLLETITLVRDNLNPKLEIEGILLTMQDRRVKLSDQVISEVRNYFKGRVYNTNIPRNIRLSEAPSFGKPIILYDPKSAGAKAYIKLAKEVVGNE